MMQHPFILPPVQDYPEPGAEHISIIRDFDYTFRNQGSPFMIKVL